MRIISCILFLGIFWTNHLFAQDSPASKVNGAAISHFQVEQATDQLIPRATYHGDVSEATRAGFREKALENLIDLELKYQYAVAKGMKPDKKQVKDYLSKIRDQYRSKKEYKKALEQAGMTEDALRSAIEKDVLVKQIVEKTVTGPSRITENEVRDYYSKNVEQFMLPDSVKLKIISCKEEIKARSAHTRIKAGENFGSVAATASEDKYRVLGGDAGYLHRGRLLQELEDVAFALKIGETSDPVKADGMWYIMQVEDRQPGRQIGFDETKDKLKQQLESKREQERMTQWVAELRSKAKIEILSPASQ